MFLTNNTIFPALAIAALYKNHWQVELFFKRIKQHLLIKRFIGNSDNAMKAHDEGASLAHHDRLSDNCHNQKNCKLMPRSTIYYVFIGLFFLRKSSYLKPS